MLLSTAWDGRWRRGGPGELLVSFKTLPLAAWSSYCRLLLGPGVSVGMPTRWALHLVTCGG